MFLTAAPQHPKKFNLSNHLYLLLYALFLLEVLSAVILFTLWSVSLQREYFAKHPGGVNPVRANDVFFTVHAILLTFITILQCVFYDVSKLLFV